MIPVSTFLQRLLLPKQRLPVLMYHSIKEIPEHNITTASKYFEQQLQYLQKAEFQPIFIGEIKNKGSEKSVLITFDDGYLDNLLIVQPLLQKYGMKATIFIPSAKIGVDEDKMNVQQLKNLDPSVFELALHSHQHENYEKMDLKQLEEDLKLNMLFFEKHQIPYVKAIAYPYGKFPKSKEFFALLEHLGIEYGFRIGNRINTLPLKNKFQILRLDVDGFTSIKKFKRKLTFGKTFF